MVTEQDHWQLPEHGAGHWARQEGGGHSTDLWVSGMGVVGAKDTTGLWLHMVWCGLSSRLALPWHRHLSVVVHAAPERFPLRAKGACGDHARQCGAGHCIQQNMLLMCCRVLALVRAGCQTPTITRR